MIFQNPVSEFQKNLEDSAKGLPFRRQVPFPERLFSEGRPPWCPHFALAQPAFGCDQSVAEGVNLVIHFRGFGHRARNFFA
jgi:hypothetical protein